MSHTAQPAGGPAAEEPYQGVQPTDVTAWVGWIAFAAFMMFLVGLFHAIAGLVALFKDEYFLVGREGLVVNVDYTTWGWIHIVGGAVMILAALGLLLGNLLARLVAVLIAIASAVVNIAFLEAHPMWATIMIAIDILVIWALIVHGDEMKRA